MSSSLRVPFLDLRAHHEPMRADLMAAFGAVLDQSAFAGGPFVERFENEFATFCRTKYAVGLANGTDALWLALRALNIGVGDEVITVPSTFIATAEAISLTGATPVFVDVDPATSTMDPAKLSEAITPRTKAIIPVHLYGHMARMDAILEIASRHRLPVIEDACQAHGAEWKGQRAGSMGVMGCFSFYPSKNLGALGEAGAVVTNDPSLAARLRSLREHGQRQRYFHSEIGWNARMDGVQGALLSVKLRQLEQANAARRVLAARYSTLLAATPGLQLPTVHPDATPVYHLYVVRVAERDAVLAELQSRGIGCAVHYPVPVHRQEAYSELGYGEGTLPVAEAWARSALSLPLYPELSDQQVQLVADELRQVLAARHARHASAA